MRGLDVALDPSHAGASPSTEVMNGTTKGGSGARGILSLPNEILLSILAQLDPTLEIPRVDDRAWLSVESFRLPPPRDEGAASYVASFRLTCKKFSEVGIQHQFKRVVTRFSVAGFKRLENIAAQPHIAKVVQKFSYMVPRVYLKDKWRIKQLQHATDAEANGVLLRQFFEKAKEQVEIVEKSIDENTLEAAIFSFERLQHIRVLRVEDRLDVAFLTFVNNHREVAAQHVELEWGPVSLRAAGTLGRAVLLRGSPASRWSFPLVDTQSAVTLMNSSLMHNRQMGVSSIAASLECLSLRFEDSGDLNSKMRELSPLFRTVFESAINIVSVHIGFPQASVSIALEEVFHNIKMEKLRVFSIGGWRLDADEIINLCHCYRVNLRGLRLHGVLMKEGGMWKDVLEVLRKEMLNLRWISLSKADYATHFDENSTRMDVTEDLETDSDVDDEMDDDEIEDSLQELEEMLDPDFQDLDDAELSSDDDAPEADSDIDSVDDLDPTAHAFTTQVDHPDLEHVCTCSSRTTYLDVDDLGDNGTSVTQSQRKMWERWVVGCLVHSRNDHSPSAIQARQQALLSSTREGTG